MFSALDKELLQQKGITTEQIAEQLQAFATDRKSVV